MDLELIKEIIEIIEPIATIIAIMVGGFWSYMLFVKNRLKYPRAKISHQVFHKKLLNDKVLLHVVTKISNVGNVLLTIVSGRTWIQQMLPLQEKCLDDIHKDEDPVSKGATEINWPLIHDRKSEWSKGKFEIEPGEDDEICYDFIIDSNIQTIIIYSYFQNIKKRCRDLGWSLTTIYDFQEKNRKED